MSIELHIAACVCMDISYSRVRINRVDNPARGQPSRENLYSPVSVRAWYFGLTRRVRPFHPASDCPFSTLRWNLELTRGISPGIRGGFHLLRVCIQLNFT